MVVQKTGTKLMTA